MKCKVTYLKSGVTQTLTTVEQHLYDNYQSAKSIFDNKETFNALDDVEQDRIIVTLKHLKWVNDLIKSGKGCTTQSPLGKALLECTGEVILPEAQGGVWLLQVVYLE